ncbi:MAG TPA: CHAT domain-containing protein [Lapillicoccus sp.]|nr:CHAT domain-containing protein [Lapillicoccus sp.]
MPGVDVWCALADEVVATNDPALAARTQDALVALGMTDDERRELVATIRGREDPAGLLLARVATNAHTDPSADAPETGAATPEQMDAALALSAQLLAGPVATMAARLGQAARDVLAHLPADAAGSLVSGLVSASLTLSDATMRTAALSTIVDATRDVTMGRLPVASVVTDVVAANPSEQDRDLVAMLLARASSSRLLSGVLDSLREGTDPSGVVALLDRVAALRDHGVAAPSPPPGADAEIGLGGRPKPGGTIWRGGSAHREIAPATQQPPGGVLRSAYPRIDVDAHREVRPEVAILDEPFDVIVGLGKFQDSGITQTGAMRFMAGATTDLDLVLVYDPNSLVAQGDTRLTVHVSDADPYPSASVSFVAQYRPDLPVERRVGVHYIVGGQVVGIAWRTVVVVPYAKDLASAPAPSVHPDALMDLEPLLGTDQPDLILSICASDGAATGEFVWTAYAGASDVTVPDAPRSSTLDSDLQGFVTEMRQTVSQSQGPFADYLSLAGKAKRMGRAIPDGIQSVLRSVIEDTTRAAAPTILLLTEEVTLPWEIAVLDPPLDTTWGGISPFLGSHAAIARWPLTEKRPRPSPRSAVAVKRAAVLTADYTGVMGWGELKEAQEEGTFVQTLFTSAVPVTPSLRDVVNLLSGNPPADVVHVALHGQFDAQGDQGGLVLLATDAAGNLTTRSMYLTPDQVLNGSLDDGPFVFLNACQVGSDKRVLADNGGFASTLLQIGASAVVAPLWNVNDVTAAQFARGFYAATWTATGEGGQPAPVSAAEAVRALRAQYTQAAAEAETPGVDATLIAFQVFGHPRLRLDRG